MSNHDNHKRNEEKRTEHGSRYENHENDRNSANARTDWKKIKNRSMRRTGKVTPKFHNMKDGKLAPLPEE